MTKLRLALDVPGVTATEVSRRAVMSVFAARRMQPGLQLPVYVNPGDHADLVLVWWEAALRRIGGLA